jgi:tape measure domain-containing protein
MPELSEVKVKVTTEADGRGLDEAEKKIAGFSKNAVNASMFLTGGFIAAGTAMVGAGLKSIQMGAQFEQSQVAFTQMLGSAEKSDAFLKQLFDFAAKTPFEFTGLQDASRRLLAYGFEANEIIPIMTRVGDAVSALGGGTAEINRATLALGQMQAKGKVSGEANAGLMHKYANFGATDAEKSALQKYTGNGYKTINSKLRAAGGDSYAAKSMTVKALDSVIKRAPVTDIDMKLRRDFSFGPMFTHIEKYGTLNGTVMTDRGFSSTSARMNWSWSGGFKATILLPKGSQGIYTGGTHDYSSHPGESEFILPRETRYKIVSTKKSGSYTELVMEAYTPNHPKYHTITPGFGHKGNEY